eukprot:comp21785_c0_seq1/m.30947 comp21785_c0_seq1/g.30947  ORF comp21785_c0_seq1/g.30947 comp21785_c0_seq1/m.30947 type:complete len:500 (-) comp21785_c0_seq1:533-2032(-)
MTIMSARVASLTTHHFGDGNASQKHQRNNALRSNSMVLEKRSTQPHVSRMHSFSTSHFGAMGSGSLAMVRPVQSSSLTLPSRSPAQSAKLTARERRAGTGGTLTSFSDFSDEPLSDNEEGGFVMDEEGDFSDEEVLSESSPAVVQGIEGEQEKKKSVSAMVRMSSWDPLEGPRGYNNHHSSASIDGRKTSPPPPATPTPTLTTTPPTNPTNLSVKLTRPPAISDPSSQNTLLYVGPNSQDNLSFTRYSSNPGLTIANSSGSLLMSQSVSSSAPITPVPSAENILAPFAEKSTDLLKQIFHGRANHSQCALSDLHRNTPTPSFLSDDLICDADIMSISTLETIQLDRPIDVLIGSGEKMGKHARQLSGSSLRPKPLQRSNSKTHADVSAPENTSKNPTLGKYDGVSDTSDDENSCEEEEITPQVPTYMTKMHGLGIFELKQLIEGLSESCGALGMSLADLLSEKATLQQELKMNKARLVTLMEVPHERLVKDVEGELRVA